jgi:repressor LexA
MNAKPLPLTGRQKQILEFIDDFQERMGLSPTYREICENFGFSSYGTAHKHLKILEEKGHLRRGSHRKRGLERIRPESESPAHELPYFGMIAAGQPIEALPGRERLAVPEHLLGRLGTDHYVLKVVGNSMIGEGIHEGDLVVVERKNVPDRGDMVVALLQDEVTLKRFYPEGRQVRLQPANPDMEPLFVPADQLRVQGVVVGLMRRY